tara:strand:+ start:370 stop:876 length:507 start_codon:yes stop_codon:yes gene_type:complete
VAYFTHFNRINYDIKGVDGLLQITPITNIVQRARMKTFFINHQVYFSKYLVKDGETPEILANEFYGDSELHWIILFAQQVINPYYDWPIHYFDLLKYTEKKYVDKGGLTGVHHYMDEKSLVVDIWAAGAVPVTNIEYEEKINDKKREIDMVRPDQINEILKEMKNILR